jgi:heterodisulfide reductase subunit A-like polyferredoxin
MCLKYLNKYLILPHHIFVEFVNIREQCAWAHKDSPGIATHKALQTISAGVSRVLSVSPAPFKKQPVMDRVLIIGGGLANLTAAKALSTRGHHVELIANQKKDRAGDAHDKLVQQTLEQLHKKNVIMRPWPDNLKLNGSPGNYEAIFKYDIKIESIPTGAVLVDVKGLSKQALSQLKEASVSGLLGRILSRTTDAGFFGSPDTNLLHGITIKETAGIFLLPHSEAGLPEEQVIRGLAAAARVSTYLEQKNIKPRDLAISIDNRLCRGCSNCADICSFIEMRKTNNGAVSAFIDKALCLGCGTCIATCPTGAITQPLQNDKQIIATLCSLLSQEPVQVRSHKQNEP